MNPYKSEKLQNMPECAMRPGGIELTRRLITLAGLKPGARILDVGCGLGDSAAFLTGFGFDAVGVDSSRALTMRGRELFPGLYLIESEAENLPFGDSDFDAVLFECSLSLMDAPAALAEAARVMRLDGRLLVSDVFSSVSGDYTAGICLRTRREFERLLLQSGFELYHFENMTNALESYAAQLIMSTGSMDAIFDCDQWAEIKKAKPEYCLAVARRES